MNPLSFLSQVTVAAVEAVKPVNNRAPKQWQPLEADLRVWSSGAVFPSAALIAEFGLEYTAKDAEDKGFGIDIIDIAEMPAIKSPERFVAMSFTAKSSPKVDLFGMTKYAEDGSPLASVADQGSATFGKESLLPLLADVYGAVPNAEGFIDLVIHRAIPFESPNGIFRFPKKISRGAEKGEISYVRRENQTVFALTAVEAAVVVSEEEVPAELPEFDFTSPTTDTHAVLVDETSPAEIEDTISAEDNPFGNTDTPVFAAVTGKAK